MWPSLADGVRETAPRPASERWSCSLRAWAGDRALRALACVYDGERKDERGEALAPSLGGGEKERSSEVAVEGKGRWP